MIEKIKSLTEKLRVLIRTNKKAFTVTTASLLAVVAVTILVCTAVLNENDGEVTDEEIGFQWGDGVTEGIPEFSSDADNIEHSDEFAAAYYSNVKGERAEEYISLVEKECGVRFQGRQYPLTADLTDRIIAIHYNVTEMNFSVTVAKKT